ncbi:MAG: hypothetical protein B7C24_17110 [Bacteroidetes bacterium 4572_77]|nr:MAG: hypothetical protein B7C24_17110 [Bacteroidetes bacterium 4572_77]
MAGAFLAAEKALYKKVVVMITDGNATGNAEEIIKKAKELDITVFTVVLNIKCPPILKAIALQTGGQWFENVNGKQEAKEIYQKILKMAQGADPCEIEWDSDIPCSSSRRFVEIQYQDESSIDSYLPSLDYIAKLNYSPSYINFGGVTPWEERNTTLTITAKNADFLITDISLKYGSENYTIEDIEYPFPIFEGESEEISIHFAPDDSTYNYAVFDIVSDVCPFQFSVHGGYPEVDITEPTIELIFPNGGEELVVGSDTSITWQGLSVNDNITIQYSTDQGANWLSVKESANNLNYIWKSIPATTSDNCLVKIKQTNEETPGDIDWEKSFGGDSLDNIYSSIVKTYDGGYIVAGTTFSTDGDIDSAHKGGSDYWVMKFNSSFDLEWQKCYGGSSDDDASSIIQTVDNGYAVVGCTWSNDGDVTNNNGDYDFWVVKLDAIGDIQWQKCYGGSKWDRATSIVQTTDGGFVITGDSFSSDGDIDKNRGGSDILVLKVDVDGGLEWSKSFGGEARGDDGANSIIQTLDGGYVVGGYTWTEVGSIAGKGANDFWIIKLDANGKEEWDKILGGTDWDFGRSVIQTLDGGYIGAGYSKSIDGDIVGNNGHDDIWAVKLNSIGDTQWSRVYGGAGNDHASSIMQTPTGSYVIVGETYSNDGDITENKGGYDYWLLKLGEFGDLLWQRTYGGSSNDCAKSLIQTSDAGYIVAGDTWSDDGDVSINYGQSDFWFLKISPEGLPVQSDVSDVVFSIVMPEITVNNIDMGDVFIGSRQYADVQNYIVNSGDYRIRIA